MEKQTAPFVSSALAIAGAWSLSQWVIERAPFLTDDRQTASTTVLHRIGRAPGERWRNSRGVRVRARSCARRGWGAEKRPRSVSRGGRRRIETRVVDIPVTWDEVVARNYETWIGNHILIDTAGQEIAQSLATSLRLVSEPLD